MAEWEEGSHFHSRDTRQSYGGGRIYTHRYAHTYTYTNACMSRNSLAQTNSYTHFWEAMLPQSSTDSIRAQYLRLKR